MPACSMFGLSTGKILYVRLYSESAISLVSAILAKS